MFSKLEALVGLEKFRVIFFITVQKIITQNFRFHFMVPYVKVKFQVIVFGCMAKNDNSELSLQSNSMCHRKIPTCRLCPVHKSNHSEFT